VISLQKSHANINFCDRTDFQIHNKSLFLEPVFLAENSSNPDNFNFFVVMNLIQGGLNVCKTFECLDMNSESVITTNKFTLLCKEPKSGKLFLNVPVRTVYLSLFRAIAKLLLPFSGNRSLGTASF